MSTGLSVERYVVTSSTISNWSVVTSHCIRCTSVSAGRLAVVSDGGKTRRLPMELMSVSASSQMRANAPARNTSRYTAISAV